MWNVSTICNMTFGSPDYEALSSVMNQFYNGTRGCPCRPACLEENYPAASVSSVKWPNEKHQETAANAFGMDSKSVAENLVKINVYYTSLNEKTIQDEIVYSLQDGSFFSALGGCLSLWLGISFCSLFE